MRAKRTKQAIEDWLTDLGNEDEERVLGIIRQAARKAFKNGRDESLLANQSQVMAELKIGHKKARLIIKTLEDRGAVKSMRRGRGNALRFIPLEVNDG